MAVTVEQVNKLLNPRTIALVGASESNSWAAQFIRNLRYMDGFSGEVVLVNPRSEEAFGQVCYRSVAEAPVDVDHAAIVVGAQRVPDVLEDCARAGVRGATVIASGFAEAGEAGARLAERVVKLCDEHGIALIGPNCVGFNNYVGTGSFVSSFDLIVPPIAGPIALSLQSGAIASSTADACYARGIRLKYLISSGNELVVDVNDLFECFLADDDILVMGAMIERIPDPARFADIARRAMEAGKPIVLLKAGRSAAASRIALAHTGAITGSQAVTDAFLNDLGIIQVRSTEELAETAGLLARHGWPRGRRVAVCAYSGGVASIFADLVDGTDLEIQPFDESTRARLSELSTRPEEVVHNPFDITADGQVNFVPIVEALAADENVDIVVAQGVVTRWGVPDPYASWRDEREKALFASAAKHDSYAAFWEPSDFQPGILGFHHDPVGGAHYVLGANGVRALSNAAWYGTTRERILKAVPVRVDDPDELKLPHLGTGNGAFSESESKALLSAYGIPVTLDVFAADAEAAAAAADGLGYPVVMKVVAPEVAHKSDAGGVVLDLNSPEEVRAAYAAVVASVRAHQPSATIAGVTVTRQADGAREFLLGITSDPVLGPAVVVGLGGVDTELIQDIAVGRPPFTDEAVDAMLGRLRCARLLDGYRGSRPLDRGALIDAVHRVGRLALDHAGTVVELDINPLFVFPEGQGVLAADALVVTNNAAHNPGG